MKIYNILIKTLSLPKVWILNLILVQEKKIYNFYVVLLFAFFVALARFSLEFMLAHNYLFMLNKSMLNLLTFYLQSIFLYTFILWLFIPKFEWKKSIHLVLIGVFLGIFPPLIDTAIYGVGNFSYSYLNNLQDDWNLFIFNEEAGVPLGETITVFATMFLVSIVVWIKTNNILRTIGSFLATYLAVFFWGSLLPYSADILSAYMHQTVIDSSSSVITKGGLGEPTKIPMFEFLQILVCVVIYFILNPVIFFRLAKRLNHAIPVVMTTLLGYGVYKSLDAYGYFIAVLMFFAALVVLVQNDFFDREEDAIDGREAYLTNDDVAFFNVMLMLVIALLVSAANLTGYMVMLFLVAFFLYNYDYYRGKKYFPSNYKLEAIAGLASYLAGVSMVIATEYKISGDMLNVTNMSGLSTIQHPMENILAEIWSSQNIWIAFSIFGGWSIMAVIKDYKDIKSDRLVGNQSIYTLLLKRGRDYKKFHRLYTLMLSLLLLIPVVWLASISASFISALFLIIMCVLFYKASNREENKMTVALSLGVINLYLANLVVAFHLSHLS